DKFTQRALDLAEKLGHTGNLCNLLSWVALRYLVERDLQQALEVTDRMAALADEYGMAYYSMLSRVIRGAGMALTEPAQAAELIEKDRPRLEVFRAYYLYPTLLCFLAEALIRLGRSDQASAALDQAEARAERSGVRWWDPELHRVRAVLARQAGDSVGATEEL